MSNASPLQTAPHATADVASRAGQRVDLPPPDTRGGLPLMQALGLRRTQREFCDRALPVQVLSNLLWAAFGVNRPQTGGRTAPSAHNQQEITIHAALRQGLFRYDAAHHCLLRLSAHDIRAETGAQRLVDVAPLQLVYVADLERMNLVPAAQREMLAAVSAGAIAQNVYLYAASTGLATVERSLFHYDTLARAMHLPPYHRILLTQTVGYPEADGAV